MSETVDTEMLNLKAKSRSKRAWAELKKAKIRL